jgi:hypothetical protein
MKINTENSAVDIAKSQGKLRLDYEQEQNRHVVRKLWTDCFGGNFDLNGSLIKNFRQSNFKLSASSSSNQLSKVLSALEIQYKGGKEIDASVRSFKLDLSGDLNKLLESVSGTGTVQIYQEHAERGGLVSKLTSALTIVPLVGGLFNYLKENNQQISHTFTTDFSVGNQQVLFSKSRLTQERFNIEGSGTLKFDGLLALTGDVIVLQETAGNLALGIPGLSQLFRRVGRVKNSNSDQG